METRSSPSMQELRAIAHERGLKYYMHLSKPELFSLLQRKEGGGSATKPAPPADATKEDVMRRVERTPTATATATRTSERLSSRKKKRKTRESDKTKSPRDNKKAKMVINTLDPIMLTELGPHTFEFTRRNGSVVVYNVESLVQYILATGDFSEPETRIPFSDEDLRRIDVEASKAKIKENSVVDAKKNKHKFEEQKIKRDGILGLERCASDYVNKMLEIVESDDPEGGEMLLIMSVFPSFSDIFEQIRRSDTEYAKHSMGHFIQYVKGPKNRPTVDNSGLMQVILGFLEDVAKGEQGASAFGF
ncbi:hypothetical protein F441_05705 [Phytophthora nicotianae CJ01A1]|uniref:Uncharacterized protein n=5 Tax=Phytophthora nicotianae TaxID=4792 RepID=W2QEW8_PHYN3|nr:hypothetical protein PPTG_10295 [Phytophthora nicotianae INRA-310]ETI50827.1 hypothetical protein F443_05697 [Phytophthora nicotianae P1569]ETK90708.1 hypothetical protein L915_05559 [Phytophthora nicotianae]ETP20606.1 hypothetical protein F441_05705 [Phytophthora nicotianae CJ01A1]ETP48526.1 hypothetical protein F442_05744 [Phytophthora nicotianae P10297]ETL44116.1 hypothetical protein L916_05501 [Phytophthora nicotianae]